jgi:hypothetical protein
MRRLVNKTQRDSWIAAITATLAGALLVWVLEPAPRLRFVPEVVGGGVLMFVLSRSWRKDREKDDDR